MTDSINDPSYKPQSAGLPIIAKKFGGEVPTLVSLNTSVRHVPESGKRPVVARAGVKLRVVVDALGNLKVITRNGQACIPVQKGNYTVLEAFSIDAGVRK
jgi:hypothetical protein